MLSDSFEASHTSEPATRAAVLTLLVVPALACTTPQTTSDITTADLQRRVSILADDSTMGRETGSPGDDAAARYVAAEFHRLGLEPAGEGGTYFQTVPLRVRRLVRASTSLHMGADTLVLGTDYVPLPAFGDLPWGPVRPLHDARSIAGGMLGDTAHSHVIDSAAAAGRVVVLTLPPGAGLRAVNVLFAGLPARLRGAAAIAVVALDHAPPRLAESAALPVMRVDSGQRDIGDAPAILVISASLAKRLLGGAHLDGHVDVLEGPPDVPAHNVIAVLRGNGTYVSISAHHDHVGFNRTPADHDSLHAYMRAYERLRQASPTLEVSDAQAASIHVPRSATRRADSIFNGADDDASGIAAELEIAEWLASRPRPTRSILFLAHTGEEKGLLGSSWYSDHPTVPRDSIVAEMDMDMVGRGAASDLAGGGPAYLELIGSRRQSTEFGNLIDSINARRAQPFTINYAYDAHDHPEGDWCRADHYSYARYGIPVAAFSTSYHGDYHQVTDESQYLDYPHLAAIARLIADVAVATATLDHRPVLDKPKPPNPHAECVQ